MSESVGVSCPSCGGALVAGESGAPICARCAWGFALSESATTDSTGPGSTGPVSGPASRERIGPYLLRRVLGEGGMGIVWEAEQQEPVRRRVALKCIRVGLDGGQFQARFESERQALALMSHPNIARAFDAGCTAEGQPYYAMEMVDGPWITRYCDGQRLDMRRRLELFVEVCRGIQHAHQRGVIHRDIKPSNILIQVEAGRPVPKVIDFGVAKAMGASLTDRTLVTRVGQMVGTPEYMSPEQAGPAGFDVDTRTDVYSLGTLLYELLTGRLPFESTSGDTDEVRRKIREEEPVRPSARVAEATPDAAAIAGARGTQPAALARALRGDLDWIVLKALAKDRARRYGTPDDLAADIERYLGHEPVVAGPPSTLYRTWKFVRRHRFGVTAASLTAAGLIAFGVVMTFETARVARERDRANAEATKAQRVSGFLESLFQSIDPARARGKEVTVREVLDAGRLKIQKELEAEPSIEVPLLVTLGGVYRELNAFAPAHELLEEAVRKSNSVNGPNARETLRAENNLASTLFREGKLEEARTMQGALLPRTIAALGNDDPDTLQQMNLLGVIDVNRGRNKEAEEILHEALERMRRVLGPESPQTLTTMSNLARAYRNLFRYKEAEALCKETLEAQRRVLGPDHPETMHTLANLAGIYNATRRFAEAERTHREAYEIRRRILGEDHFLTLESLDGVASAELNQKKFAEGGMLERKIAEAMEKSSGPDAPARLGALEGVGIAEDGQGHPERAQVILTEVFERSKRVYGPEDQDTLVNEANLAVVDAHLGRFDEAESLARDMLQVSRQAMGDKNPLTALSLYSLGSISAQRRRKQQALEYLHQAQAAGGSLTELLDDQDFAPLRGDPEFESLLSEVKAASGSGAGASSNDGSSQ